MKQTFYLLKTLLVAVGMLVGGVSSAWAYDVPDGYGVKNVFIGTAGSPNANGVIKSVTAEDFESLASLPSAWSAGTVNSVSLADVTEVAKPAVDAVPTGVPTYVSGKTMQAYLRKGTNNGTCYADYTLGSTVSSGKLVFSSDLFESGNVSDVLILRFLDSDGNPVLTLKQNGKSDSHTYYSYIIGTGEAVQVGSYSAWRTYVGMQIKDLVIDLTTGETTFSMDYIARRKIGSTNNYYRTQTDVTAFNIGEGKNIAKIQIGKNAISSTNLYFNMDNVELYTVEPVYGWTINYTNGGSTIKSDNGEDFKDAIINASESVTVGALTYVPASGATTSLTVTTTPASNVLNVPVVASVPYTISYKYNGTTIKTENGYAETGTQVTATHTSLWNDGGDTKYYVADAATTTFDVTAGDNNFEVPLRLAATGAVAIINAKAGGNTHKSFTSLPGIEGEAVTVYYSMVIKSDVDDKFYTVSTADYSKSLTYGESVDVDYTLDDTGIVYFGEVEDLSNSVYPAEGTAYSGGYCAAIAGSKATNITSLDAGFYSVTGYCKSNAFRGLILGKSASSAASAELVNLQSATDGIMSGNFVVPVNSTSIYLRGKTQSDGKINQSADLDYVLIRRTGDLPASENIVVTSAGYATYVSNYNLDFTSATTKAYKVNVASQGVATLTEVEQVPAKTPVLLYKEGGNGEGEAITISSAAMDAVTGNDLVAGTGAAVATTSGDYTNMILNNVDSKIGFYFAAGNTVAANRAYLHIATSLAPSAVSGARMSIVFADEDAAGISDVKEFGTADSAVYSLSGQRVSQPTKGLYIVNGKKVIVK